MNINKIELEKLRMTVREAQTLIYNDPRTCSKVLEDLIFDLGEVERKHYQTLKKVADKGLLNE